MLPQAGGGGHVLSFCMCYETNQYLEPQAISHCHYIYSYQDWLKIDLKTLELFCRR